MRTLLLRTASLLTGFILGVAIITVVLGEPSLGFPGIVGIWVFGMILSAPFFLRPPQSDGGAVWLLPLNIYLLSMVARAFSWFGFQVLNITWAVGFAVVGLVRDRSAAKRQDDAGV